jgi:hypothetical protein
MHAVQLLCLFGSQFNITVLHGFMLSCCAAGALFVSLHKQTASVARILRSCSRHPVLPHSLFPCSWRLVCICSDRLRINHVTWLTCCRLLLNGLFCACTAFRCPVAAGGVFVHAQTGCASAVHLGVGSGAVLGMAAVAMSDMRGGNPVGELGVKAAFGEWPAAVLVLVVA